MSTQLRRKYYESILGLVCISISAALLGGCDKNAAPPQAAIEKIGKVDIVDNLTLSGALESEESVEIKSEVSGTIEKLLKKEGDRVKRGDTILVINPLQLRIRYERNKLAREKSQIELSQAKLDLKEAEGLQASGGIPARQLKDLKWRVELAQIALSESQSECDETKYLLGKSSIVSPITGTLASLGVKVGEVIVAGTASVGGGTLLGSVVDLHRMRVSIGVSELDYPFINPDQATLVSTEAEPSHQFRGHVSYISPVARELADKNIRFFEVRISLDSAGPKMAPGINVSVQIPILSLHGVVGIRNELIQTEADGNGSSFVWKVDGETTVKTPIQTGRTNYLYTEIKSGIREGDLVASAFLPGSGNAPTRLPATASR